MESNITAEHLRNIFINTWNAEEILGWAMKENGANPEDLGLAGRELELK